MALQINTAEFLERSKANGPGVRAVLWVQGCPIRCKDCFNRNLWSFEKNNTVEVSRLAERISAVRGIEGVTFSGGEPFSQAEELAELGGILQKNGLNIVTFTGYEYRQIQLSNRPGWHGLLAVTDLLIEGPIQYDTATSREVANIKFKDSKVAGKATVYIFPDLDAGNTAYKAVQRSANVPAIGPVLQGLNKPANDLSRGATVTDIVYTIAITAIQAQESR